MKKSILFLLLVLSAIFSDAQIPDKPNPPRLVNNFSKEFPDFFSASEQADLEQKLEAFAKKTSNQITVVVVDDLAGMDEASYATALGNQWGVGQSDFKNGVVLLIKPTGGKGQRKIFIAVGKGLEGAITDIATKRIIDQDITPAFKQTAYYDGVNKAVTILMGLSKGEYNEYRLKPKKNITRIIIIVVVFILIIFFSSISNSRTSTMGSRGIGYGGGWFMGGGGFGGGSSGSSGGGFGGFGGGSFGGGGSGGSW